MDNEETKEAYTRAKANDERPEIKLKIFDEYPTIFLNHLIWYRRYPIIINIFLESYDFTGKTVVPFHTHKGSGDAGACTTIKNKSENSNIVNGSAIRRKEASEDSSKQIIANQMKQNS